MKMRTLLDGTSNAENWAPSSPPPPPPVAASAQRSPWHSPVPYLFGGLAAMLGLIAFALLILACSYWKISGSPSEHGGDEGDVEKGAAEKRKEVDRVYEEKIVVIMAGDEKPSYLAMPVCSRGPSFGDCKRKGEDQETKKEEINSFRSKVNKDDHTHGTDLAADHQPQHEHALIVAESVESKEAPLTVAEPSQAQDGDQ